MALTPDDGRWDIVIWEQWLVSPLLPGLHCLLGWVVGPRLKSGHAMGLVPSILSGPNHQWVMFGGPIPSGPNIFIFSPRFLLNHRQPFHIRPTISKKSTTTWQSYTSCRLYICGNQRFVNPVCARAYIVGFPGYIIEVGLSQEKIGYDSFQRRVEHQNNRADVSGRLVIIRKRGSTCFNCRALNSAFHKPTPSCTVIIQRRSTEPLYDILMSRKSTSGLEKFNW